MDQDIIHNRAQDLLGEVEQETAQAQMATGAESQEEGDKEEHSQAKQEGMREKRLSRRPGWLKDFIMYARS